MVCQNCKNDFSIEAEDADFYAKISVPPPTFCPPCRLQRRLAWRNERSLYRRTCDLCKKDIVARFPAEAPFPVYCPSCWYSDNWDPLAYGREYDFSMSFFEQFKDLWKVVPRQSLYFVNAVNSDYTNQSLNVKNVFLSVSAITVEDGYNLQAVDKSREVADISYGQHLERCASSVDIIQCSNTAYARWAKSCLDSLFLYDARNCSNCIGCVNVRNAKYQILNTQYTPEGYEAEKKRLDLGSYKNFQKFENEFQELKKLFPHRFAMLDKCIDTTGDNVQNAKNAKECFDSYNIENCSYLLRAIDTLKDCVDVNHSGLGAELCYEAASCRGFCNRFSLGTWGQRMEYTLYASHQAATDLFGCIAIPGKKEYCILNRQYDKEEYESLRTKIIAHMNEMPYADKAGRIYRYGEFFPVEMAECAYNESVAQEYFSLQRDEVEANGYRWQVKQVRESQITMPWDAMPDHVNETAESILQETIGCQHDSTCNENCAGAFRIFPQELALCRSFGIPLPRLCPNCRYYGRLRSRNPARLWRRQCQCNMAYGKEQRANSEGCKVYKNTTAHFHGNEPCPNTFETSYTPEQPEIIYCERCYNSEIA